MIGARYIRPLDSRVFVCVGTRDEGGWVILAEDAPHAMRRYWVRPATLETAYRLVGR